MFASIFAQTLNKKNKTAYPRSPLRVLLMLLIFCAVIWGFWQNTENQLKEISSRGNVWDEPAVLTPEERRGLQEMINEFKSRYGTDVRMDIIGTPLQKPKTERPLIYLGIQQETGEVLVSLPPLLRKALGDDFAQKLISEQITPRLPQKEYADAMANSLRAIWLELGKLDSE